MTILKRLSRDIRGTGAMELALCLPMLLVLLVGMIDVSRLVAARIDAEQAAQRATDYALAVRPRSANGAYIRNQATSDGTTLAEDVSVDIFLECDGERQADFRRMCDAGEDTARFVSVEIDRDVDFVFDWSRFTALFGSTVLGDGITVQGDSLVRFQ